MPSAETAASRVVRIEALAAVSEGATPWRE